MRDAPHVPQLGEQGAARGGQHRAVLVGKGEGDVGAAHSSRTRSSCSSGQVVEPVEEDRARAPAVGV